MCNILKYPIPSMFHETKFFFRLTASITLSHHDPQQRVQHSDLSMKLLTFNCLYFGLRVIKLFWFQIVITLDLIPSQCVSVNDVHITNKS